MTEKSIDIEAAYDESERALMKFLGQQNVYGAELFPLGETALRVSFSDAEDSHRASVMAHRAYDLLAEKGVEPLVLHNLPNVARENFLGPKDQMKTKTTYFFSIDKASIVEKLAFGPKSQKGMGS